LLVIPAVFNSGAGQAGIQFFLGFDFQRKASTPPLEERITSFFARAKKEVTKKESTLRAPQV
jgi:hypothetical protein